MSYSIELKGQPCPTCCHTAEPTLPNPTYTLVHIFDLALADDDATQLQKAHARLADPALEPRFRALEPSNRWGTLEDARRVIGLLLAAAEKHPAHVWSVR
jgi:hypothetical protein